MVNTYIYSTLLACILCSKKDCLLTWLYKRIVFEMVVQSLEYFWFYLLSITTTKENEFLRFFYTKMNEFNEVKDLKSFV